MPIKNEKPRLYVARPDGTRLELGEIYDINITCEPCDDCFEKQWITQSTEEYEFTVRWHPTAKILYFMVHGNFPTNNWLRMHGYGAERKRRKRGKE